MTKPADELERRRSANGADPAATSTWRTRLADQSLAVLGGEALLVITGVITTTTMPLLHPDRRSWLVLAGLSVAMTGLLVLALALPLRRTEGRWVVVFPAAVALALSVLGLAGHGVASSYIGLLVLCSAHVGLTQPARVRAWSIPLGVVAWVASFGSWDSRLTPRLVISVLIWVCLGELLAQLVARQAQLTERLTHSANTDALTGIPNRRSLTLRLATAATGDSVVLCDLDHFKRLNDTRGHTAGDQALADFGAALRACLRESDFAARYGGEEFAILLPGTTAAQAESVLDRLRAQWQLLQPTLTFSAGVATCHPNRDAMATLAAADRGLYRAKAEGRNRTCRADLVPLEA